MEVPKGEHSASSISLNRVLREGVMGLSKIALFCTLLLEVRREQETFFLFRGCFAMMFAD
jgi:hypothetical protein